jgi:hypothetical protein
MQLDEHPQTLSCTSSFDNIKFLNPYNESYMRTTASVPDESLWIDACRIIHVTTLLDELCKPSVEHIRILKTPPSLPPESEPPPYIDANNESVCQMMMFLPVPDRHQHLLDYFKMDLPTLSDEHPSVLKGTAEDYILYCHCQDNLCATDWDPEIISVREFADEIDEPFPTPGPRSEQDWEDQVLNLLDHCVHSHALIAKVKDSLSTQMLNEGLH